MRETSKRIFEEFKGSKKHEKEKEKMRRTKEGLFGNREY